MKPASAERQTIQSFLARLVEHYQNHNCLRALFLHFSLTRLGAAVAVRSRREVHISWDEPTIAEHDKLRGTRQKIDEPSTPYHYGSGESSTGSDCESTGMSAAVPTCARETISQALPWCLG